MNTKYISIAVGIIISIGIAQAAGLIGSLFTFSAITTWYATLVKPSFNPPNWIFGPVWSLLYTLMGLAAFMVWQKRKQFSNSRSILSLYGIHLIVNTLWSIVFFGQQNPSFALFIIVILWLMIVAMIVLFRKYSLWASWLLVPYLLWVSFATILNYQIVILN